MYKFSEQKTLFILVLILINLLGCSDSNVAIFQESSSEISSEKDITKENEDVLSGYNKVVETFKKIDTDMFRKKIDSNNTFFIYFGRKTCPYCREFVPKLREISESKQIDIYYLDTENTETDITLQEIRKEFKVEYVPTLIYIKNGKSYSIFLPDDDLESFLETTPLK